MTIDLACPGCGKSYTLPESQRGKRARCKRCGEEFRIDRPEPELRVPEPPKLAYTEPAISLAKPPLPPMMAPPPPPTLRPAEPVVIYPKPASARAVKPESIPVECPHCRYRYDVDTALGGKRARCKSCKEVFRLPEAAAVVPTPAAPVARVASAVPVAQAIPGPAWDAEAPEVKAGWSWSIPPGGLGPLKVALVAVGGCVAVVGIGVVVRALTHGADPKKPPKDAPPVVAGRPNPAPPAGPRGGPAPAAASAGFDPFPDEPPAPTIRDDVVRRHRSSFQALADAGERLVAFLRTIDGPPDEAALGKMKAIASTLAELTSARAALPKPNATEEYRVLAEFAARLIDLGARQKAEIRRVLAMRPGGELVAVLRRQSAGSTRSWPRSARRWPGGRRPCRASM